LGGGEEDRAGRAESDQGVLVKGEPLRVIAELFEVFTEPVGERLVDAGDAFGLGVVLSARGAASAASLVGYGQGDANVEGRGDERGLAKAGVTDDRDPGGVDGGSDSR
jgi:hypothetical protein